MENCLIWKWLLKIIISVWYLCDMFLDFSHELIKLLKGLSNCAIIPHKNPDADALGSSMALSCFLIKLGKKAKVILPNSPPDYLEWMIKKNKVISYDKNPEKTRKYLSSSQIIFALDFNSLKRTGVLNTEIERNEIPIVMIDHHQSPEKFSTLFLSKPEISSTCEIIYNVMKLINSELIDKEIATYLYSGILTDTGSFRYPLTTGNTHSHLLKIIQTDFQNYLIKGLIIR